MNIAVTVRAALIVTMHFTPETESHPVHPVKIESGPVVAVSVTGESLVNDAEHALPQVIPVGFEVTLPSPSPCLNTARVSSSLTVSAALPVLPNGSVAVMVVVPLPTAVATPVVFTVATPVLLLVHVTPVPVITTGVEEPVVVPLANWPQSLTPQHFTVPSPRSAQLWCHHPQVTPTPPATPATGTGLDEFRMVLSPSWPNASSPQHCT